MNRVFVLMACVLSAVLSTVWAEAPTDPKEQQVYSHNKDWLSTFPPSFIATNIRGKDLQYKERRQAALDLLVERNEKNQAPELVEELKRNSFLSEQICPILSKWGYRRGIAAITQAKDDSKRPESVRKACETALIELSKPAPVDPGPPTITTN